MGKKFSVNEILEKLRWYHGEFFESEMLTDDFVEMLEKENKSKKIKQIKKVVKHENNK